MKNTLAFQIAALYRSFLGYTTNELKELGLNFGQMPVIVYVGKHPGCTQAELTRNLRLDWGYSQRSVTKLADGGFLTKEYDEASACNCLTLTQQGERAFAVSHNVFDSWDALKLASFTEEEKETLLSLLGRITAERKESC